MGGGTISYLYDATGMKLRKTVSTGLSTDYAGTSAGSATYVYENGSLKFFFTPEGYVEPPSTGSGAWQYVYQYKDHLGNIRLSYTDRNGDGVVTKAQAELVEEHNYYPFGLEHEGYNGDVSGSAHPYTYNGKELQGEVLGLNWLDFGARNYDAALGRWMNLDPLAEDYFDLSPYNYVANSPIFYIDPDGMKIKDPDKVVEEYKNHLNSTATAIKDLIKSGAVSEEVGGKLTSFTSSELKKIDKLEKSDQVYTFSSKTTNKEGGVQYDASTEEVKVTVGKEDIGLIGHELNHAYQFENGDISIISDNSDYGSLYDVGDETESYNVERMAKSGVLNIHKPWKNADVLQFGKTQMSPPAYQTLPTISISLRSKQGKALRDKTIEAGKNGTPVKEVYIGWQNDYAKGAKQKK